MMIFTPLSMVSIMIKEIEYTSELNDCGRDQYIQPRMHTTESTSSISACH